MRFLRFQPILAALLTAGLVLAAVPRGGWEGAASLWLDGGLLALVSGLLAGFLAHNPARLRQRVDQTTRALRESEEKYRHLVQQAESPILRLDGEGNIEFVNDHALRFFGYREEELLGRSVVGTILPPVDSSGRDMVAMLKEILANPLGHTRHEHENMRKDGERVWLAWTSRFLFDREERLTGLLCVGSDISERRRAEALLREANEELEARVRMRTAELIRANDILQRENGARTETRRALADQNALYQALLKAQSDVGEGVFLIEDGRLVFVNDAVCAISGYSREEILALPSFLELACEEDRPRLLDKHRRRLAGEQFESRDEMGLRARDGRRVETEIAVATLPMEDKTRVMVVLVDITARKRAEEELRRVRAGLEMRVQERTRELAVIIDELNSEIIERRLAEETLRRQAQIINQIHEAVIATDLAGRVSFWNRGAERMFGYPLGEAVGRPIADFYPDSPHPEGQPEILQYLETHGAYETEARRRKRDGDILYIHLVLSLLRDREGFPAGLVSYSLDITERKRLEREIIDVSEGEQKRIGQELHDGLGQHLTGIAFLSKVLEQKLSIRNLPESKDAADIVGLVNQAVSRTRALARGLFPVELEANGLMSALEQLAANVRNLYGIACEFRCADPVLVYDNVVAINLYRIAQEAVNNAVKHSRAGGILIELSSGPEGTRLSVADDGAGFERPEEGCGMGLHIMEYRARLIGSKLEIRRRPEGGTAVTVG